MGRVVVVVVVHLGPKEKLLIVDIKVISKKALPKMIFSSPSLSVFLSISACWPAFL